MSTHAIPKDQHAVLISKFGTPEVMRYEGGVQVPDIGDNQVLIKVAYAGINPVDYKTRQGKGWGADNIQKQYFDKGWSTILGFDVAGIVVKSSSDDFAIGDKVASLSFNGQCYAEYVAVEAELLAKVPKTVSLEQAGAVPCVGQTALQFIDFADIKAGEHVVMNAPAGGVGQLVVQLLMDKVATMGIKVTVICSPDKYDKISGLVDRNQLAGWIDYTKDDNFPNLQADVLLDLVGNEAGVRALSVLKPRARVFVLPTIWVDKLKEAGSDKNLSVEGYAVKPNGQDMTRVLKCLADSKLTLQIQQVYPLAQVVAAHTDLQKGDAFGKLVLAV
ncbi:MULTISPECIES: NADP-dependent oxidoreductase [unclassified Psychrobacter]|uniref:NADP-dependent oxidoreductase n=1 Tax=unclassified Psychrobacter TaxID=196806 RepID=UPI003FD3D727